MHPEIRNILRDYIAPFPGNLVEFFGLPDEQGMAHLHGVITKTFYVASQCDRGIRIETDVTHDLFDLCSEG